MWKWVKGWFDPVVVGKMYIVPAGQENQILAEHIDPEAIPKKYGGTHTYGWGDMPVLEKSIRDQLVWENGYSDMPIGPVRWEEGEDGGMVAVAVGTVEGKRREEVVMRLPKSWRDTFFRLDGEVSRDVGRGGSAAAGQGAQGGQGEQVVQGGQAEQAEQPQALRTVPGPPVQPVQPDSVTAQH